MFLTIIYYYTIHRSLVLPSKMMVCGSMALVFPFISSNPATHKREWYLKAVVLVSWRREWPAYDGYHIMNLGTNLSWFAPSLSSFLSPFAEHFEEALPNVDHMAFITSNLNEVEKQLREHNVFYKRVSSNLLGYSSQKTREEKRAEKMSSDSLTTTTIIVSFSPPLQFNSPKMGIYQIFLFDPDGNVIEISNCAPPVGETTCMPSLGPDGRGSRL